MFKKIIKITIVLICMISIFLLSNDTADQSDKKSDSVILNIYKLFGKKSISNNHKKEVINKYVFFVRKSAHFIIYLLLGLSLISLVREYREIDIKALIISFMIATLYACSDEIHQLFVSGRSCEVLDIFIDGCGSFLGIMIYYLYYRVRRIKQ